MPEKKEKITNDWFAFIFILIGIILLAAEFIGTLLGEKRNSYICDFDPGLCMVDKHDV